MVRGIHNVQNLIMIINLHLAQHSLSHILSGMCQSYTCGYNKPATQKYNIVSDEGKPKKTQVNIVFEYLLETDI